LLVYDQSREHTFEAIGEWYRRVCEAVGKRSIPGALIATKADLRERIAVPRGAGHQLAQQMSMPFFETSALENEGVLPPFQHLAATATRALAGYDDSLQRTLASLRFA